MTTVHCRGCWQPMSTLVRRCPRCGDVDKCRMRRAVVKLTIFVVATTIVVGVAIWRYQMAA